ncbi:MAG: 3-oxoacyl-ACP reductase FabG [Deltaproteobacteria bacterium]|jgi:3-oxoacyl-[acyl-carrier protein] reductase|nr:3-oxoacyl-ACP reductase FabG [Deltaproteobacteria bacterium]MBW2536058.1 3-oxoacyl-ACP reductase FabG [Deltaproteobacteria bacterium]
MFELKGRNALVTGASRGIGRAIAEALAACGAHVVLGYRAGEEQARGVAGGIEAAGQSAEIVGFDAADMAAAEQAVADTAKRLGGLDILVANAGVAIDGLLPRVREADLDRVFAVNVKGAMACARGAIRPMMRARWGRIVFVSSVAGELGNAGQAAYASSKAALIGLTKTLAREYASRSITVNAVSPGLIDTDMTKEIPDAMRERALQGIPLGRAGTPADVAGAVCFLCSEEASYVTAQVLRVNGGMH